MNLLTPLLRPTVLVLALGAASPWSLQEGCGSPGDDDDDDTPSSPPPIACDSTDLAAWRGPLCGPADRPCVTKEDSIVDEPAFRNYAPSIALDAQCRPSILFSVAVGGYHGFYATPDGDTWSSDATDMPVAAGALVIDADGSPTAVVDDGAFGVSAWKRTGGTWQLEQRFPGEAFFNAAELARSSTGDLHAAYADSEFGLDTATRTGGQWEFADLNMSATYPVVALSLQDEPHRAWWASDSRGWKAFWQGPAGEIETAASADTNMLNVTNLSLTVLPVEGAGDQPHLLLTREVDEGASRVNELVVVRRQEAGNWRVIPIVRDPADQSYCDEPPGYPGQECTYDYTYHRPLGITSSAHGEVRYLYTTLHYQGTLVASGDCSGPWECYWENLEDLSSGELRIGWLENDQPRTALLAGDSMPYRLTLRVATDGDLHIAAYDLREPAYVEPAVRYLRVGTQLP